MSAEEIARLEAKLRARQDQPGFAENVRALEARLAELRAKPEPQGKARGKSG